MNATQRQGAEIDETSAAANASSRSRTFRRVGERVIRPFASFPGGCGYSVAMGKTQYAIQGSPHAISSLADLPDEEYSSTSSSASISRGLGRMMVSADKIHAMILDRRQVPPSRQLLKLIEPRRKGLRLGKQNDVGARLRTSSRPMCGHSVFMSLLMETPPAR